MAVAFLSAQRSKDPHSQVIIIDKLIHELMYIINECITLHLFYVCVDRLVLV